MKCFLLMKDNFFKDILDVIPTLVEKTRKEGLYMWLRR